MGNRLKQRPNDVMLIEFACLILPKDTTKCCLTKVNKFSIFVKQIRTQKNIHNLNFFPEKSLTQLVQSFEAYLGSKNLKGSLGYCFCTFAMSSAYLPKTKYTIFYFIHVYKINGRYMYIILENSPKKAPTLIG